ncbi:MAG: hypothetical protein ACFFDB_20710 [Promethearchaeota archaeon]
MKVLISDIIRKFDNYGSDYTLITGYLQSGLEITIKNLDYYLQSYKGQHVEMLLSVMRSPYLELQRGIHNSIFATEEFYSTELIDEVLERKKVNTLNNKDVIILTGEYIESYTVPEKWLHFKTSNSIKFLIENVSALKTMDGTFLLNPFHSKKKIPIEESPRLLTIASGLFYLIAWYPLPTVI